MAKPEQCGQCSKPATIHLTQIINNKIHKIDLCEDCPYKKSVTDPEGFSLADFLFKGQLGMDAQGESLQCESCGFTPADFKKSGRFGCPDCYTTFRQMLMPMLSNMHKDVVHCGKIPARSLTRTSIMRQIECAEAGLQQAILAEDYEQAAHLRDELHGLNQKLEETLKAE